MIATASNSTTAKPFVDSCLLCTTPKYITFERLPLDLELSFASVRYLFVTQCRHLILPGRGRAIDILIRNHLEHTILLSGKRVNKEMERMGLSLLVIDLLRDPLPTLRNTFGLNSFLGLYSLCTIFLVTFSPKF